MVLENIVTKDKNQFLKSERNWFTSMTNDEYNAQMYDYAHSCTKCGVFYWEDCSKRCKCE